ncbi:rod shape-determining protein MreD, partial [Trebonia sp.]|uniref:rod shape-determining protein MreD n=1 Tax=Trebonia sp. TaxID=2767075 RepID=UPI002602833E
MIARRVLLSPILVFAAVIGQLTVVNRAPLPGAAVPSLVLLVVTALGVTAGPVTGMLAGFGGGLALDVAPPGGHLAGEYALVYCLAGYACGRIREAAQGGSAQRHELTSLTVMALGVAAGEAGTAGLGMMLSDPNVTGPAISHLLPATIVYDLLLCPFALWLVSAAVGRPAYERAPRTHTRAIPLAAAFRQASAGAAPRLRLAGSTAPLSPPPLRQEPRLRLASGRSSSSFRTSAAFSTAQPALGGGRPVKVNFTAGRGNQLGGVSALRQSAARPGSSPGKGWLRAGTQVTPVTWTGRSPGKGWLRGGALAPAPAWAGSSPGKGWLRVGTPIAPMAWQGRSPGRGWLRTGTPVAALTGQGSSLGRGWL